MRPPALLVVYHFRPKRSGKEVRNLLADWKGKLVCDDSSGYKASFANGMTEIGCMAHVRCKFHELHVVNKSSIAQQALDCIRTLYEVERTDSTRALGAASSTPSRFKINCISG